MTLPRHHQVNPHDRPITVYVAFGEAAQMPWWARALTAPGWRHVTLLVPQRIGTVVVDPIAQCLVVEWVPFEAEDCAYAMMRNCWEVVVVDNAVPSVYAPRGLMTCVTVAKAMLGLRSWRTITPRQLNRLLVQRGGRELG